MILSDNKSDFLHLIENTSDHFEILRIYVEKDFWLTRLLKELFSSENDYVFKGGTALSKCYRIIERFSEDIDISYEVSYSELGSSQREKRYRGVSKSITRIGLEILNKEELRRGRYFNRFICPYPSFFKDTSINKQVIVELAAQEPSFPYAKMKIQSLIGEYLTKVNRLDLVEKYELEPFEIRVQSLERTIVDKTFAVCDYYLSNKIEGHSRHFYDISKIMQFVKLDDSLVELYEEIYKIRFPSKICRSAKEGMKLYLLLDQILNEGTFKNDYETSTVNLLYEKYSYEKCCESLRRLQEFLRYHNL